MPHVLDYTPTASADDLATWVAEDAELRGDITADPVSSLAHLAKPAYEDRLIYGIVVVFLGLTILGVVVGTFVLEINKNGAQIPQALIALGSGALGALAGLLAPIGGKK